MEFDQSVRQALGAPFPEDEIDWLPRTVQGNRALAIAYIDARTVMRRLDDVVGPANWSFDFDPLSVDGKMVRGRLTVLGVTKCDAGEAEREEELLKSAVSDALKRAAVHFGIGRYLYYLPKTWADYDPQKRQFVRPPQIEARLLNHALRCCGLEPAAPARKQEPEPESRGDAAAKRAPRETPPAKPNGAKSAEAKPAEAKSPLERVKAGFFASLGEHVPETKGDAARPLRHCVYAVLAGKNEPLTPSPEWTERHWRALADQLARHKDHCSGNCLLLDQALTMRQRAAHDADTSALRNGL